MSYPATNTAFNYDASGDLVTPDPDPGHISVVDGSGTALEGNSGDIL